MKVFLEYHGRSELGKKTICFHFELENDDLTEGESFNAGGGEKIFLGALNASFHFPVEISEPHPDLAAVAALKIISPYIGSRLIMDRPVSTKAALAIKAFYPNIKEVFSSDKVSPRATPYEKPAISFSGGADSIAVACVMPRETPLIMAARTFHPDIGPFETWNKPDGPVGTMEAMPNDARKYLVYTDFPYLSSNGKYCIYPDSYAFTIPLILLADHLNISHLLTGDIIAGLTGNETAFNPVLMPAMSAREIFKNIGLQLECPCNGVSEIVTSRIVEENGLTTASSTCEYGTFKRPCMRCVKCLRKSLYVWALTGKELTPQQLDKFNTEDPVKKFATAKGRSGLSAMPSFKFAFRRIGRHFSGPIGEIQHRSYSCDIPVTWEEKYYPPVYRDRPDFVMKAFNNIKKYAKPMTEQDMRDFSRLDWKKNYQQ